MTPQQLCEQGLIRELQHRNLRDQCLIQNEQLARDEMRAMPVLPLLAQDHCHQFQC